VGGKEKKKESFIEAQVLGVFSVFQDAKKFLPPPTQLLLLANHSNCGKSTGRATDSTSTGTTISGSSFLGVLTRALIGQALI
jgi:hypothetical protein